MYKLAFSRMKFRQSKFRLTKMKTIILVFFFGIVTCKIERSKSPEITDCQQIKTTATIDDSKFFTGTWYVTHATKESTSVCHKFETSRNGGTINVNADGYYDIGNSRSFYNIPCTGTKSNNGKFTLNCQPKKKGSSTKSQSNVQVEVTVMETDNKYAVIYRCATSGTRKTENYLVLNRDEKEKMSNVQQILGKHGVKDKFISREQSKTVCNMPTVQ